MPGAREARLVASRALQCQHRQSLLHSTLSPARPTAILSPSRSWRPSIATIHQRSVSYTIPRRQEDRPDGTRSSTKDLLDEALGWSPEAQSLAQARTERAAPTQNTESSGSLYASPSESGSSVDDMIKEAGQGPMRNLYSSGQRGPRKGDHMDMANLLGPGSIGGLDIMKALDARGNTAVTKEMKLPLPLPMRLGPNVGRTVKVNVARNMDVARAFRQLEINCRVNQVKQDAARQRFHERPGLKRKRVRSERWRRTFKEGFKGMIALVKKMKKQGW